MKRNTIEESYDEEEYDDLPRFEFPEKEDDQL